MPADPAQFVYATLATALLAVGVGIFNAVITFILPLWNIVITLMAILTYATSSILFFTNTMTSLIKYTLSFNLVLQSLEWMRFAFYSDYPTDVLDKTYFLEFGLISLTLGLIMERLLRRFF